VAERNKGAFQAPLLQEVSKEWDQIQVSNVDQVENARYVESFESRHSSHEKAMSVAEFLQIANDPTRLDSQCKYAVVARGESEIYMRIPVLKKNKEFIWVCLF
jgi:3'(2'), 5'-bisphosphate nucleotidase